MIGFGRSAAPTVFPRLRPPLTREKKELVVDCNASFTCEAVEVEAGPEEGAGEGGGEMKSCVGTGERTSSCWLLFL